MPSISSPCGPTPRVLFVDDESVMLRSMERYVRTWDERWDVVCVEAAEAALSMLDAGHFDVVVSDLHMPGMDGVDLLGEVQRRFPGTVRILLSGNEDFPRAKFATRVVHQFLAKGSSPSRLRRALERARALRGVLADVELRELVTRENELASAPPIFAEVTAALSNPRVSVMQIAAIVERDPAMVARILQVVSSAFFGLPRRVSDVGEAISFLGADVVSALVLQAELFSCTPIGTDELDIDVFQQHSFAVSQLAGIIARDVDLDRSVVIPGILHDIGVLVLASRTPERWELAARAARQEGVSLHVAERAALGTTHAEVGAFLFGLWGLDDDVVDAVAFHHTPPRRPVTRLEPHDVVRIADALTHDPDAEIDPLSFAAQHVELRIDRWRARAQRIASSAH